MLALKVSRARSIAVEVHFTCLALKVYRARSRWVNSLWSIVQRPKLKAVIIAPQD